MRTRRMMEVAGNALKGMARVAQAQSNVMANKLMEETNMVQQFVVNANAEAYSFADPDVAEGIFRGFFTAVSTYLSRNKVADPEQAVALVLTDVSGKFMFAGIVQYTANENPDEPGNWNYTMTFNEDDLNAISNKRALKKLLFGDMAFSKVFKDVCYDVGPIEFYKETYFYDAYLILVNTVKGTLDGEAKDGEVVDIEMPGYFVASVEVKNGEKVISITPDGAMKEIIKADDILDAVNDEVAVAYTL